MCQQHALSLLSWPILDLQTLGQFWNIELAERMSTLLSFSWSCSHCLLMLSDAYFVAVLHPRLFSISCSIFRSQYQTVCVDASSGAVSTIGSRLSWWSSLYKMVFMNLESSIRDIWLTDLSCLTISIALMLAMLNTFSLMI